MTAKRQALNLCAWSLAVLALVAFLPGESEAYIEAPYTMGRIVNESTNIVVMRVDRVDREKNLLFYRKVRDLKGTCPMEEVKHSIGKGGFAPREWQNIMAWAEVGQTALFFYAGNSGEVCIQNYWYQVAGADWWNLNHAEPYLLRSYAGKPEKLEAAVVAMIAGQEVTLPCMIDGDKNALQLRNGKLQRLKCSLKLIDYNPKRDFAGWGVEELSPIEGMPGFTHYGPLTRIDGGARGLAAMDFEGNGRPGLCLFGGSRVVLLKNGGSSFSEVPLGVEGGASAAAWGDFNGDGRPDLLIATPTGLRLLANQKGESFKDVTEHLPKQEFFNLKAAVWIDYDGDGKLDILMADGFRGLRLYRNLGGPSLPNVGSYQYTSTAWFEDVSDKVGLGDAGLGSGAKGDHLAVADVNGDGRPDFLLSAGKGLLAINTPQGFVEAKDCGISYVSGGVTPVFGDFMGDKTVGLFVPQNGLSKLFRSDGKGHFTDVTAQSGALATPIGFATCAAWTDFNNTGKQDLMVGCLKGPNRFFRNKGGGVFADATDEIGLGRRIFNTRGLAVLDLNKDGVADVAMVNEAQDSAVLLGNPDRPKAGEKK